MSEPDRIVILTEGYTEPLRAKTAVSVLRYRGNDVVALLDSTQAGCVAEDLLGVGGQTPIVAALEDVPEANALLIGIAPSGGKIPPQWREALREAISKGMTIVSGLHEFLGDDPELGPLAAEHQAQLVDIRKNEERDVADAKGFREGCVRIQAVGQDCCVGKMVATIEMARALAHRGEDAKFVATGQTGIMIAGDGCPVDCVVSDFINGAVEKLVRKYEQHEFLLIEGQGSLAHPRYSAVTLGLLHGARPQGLVMCYEAERPHIHGMDHVSLLPLAQHIEAYQTAANLISPTEFIGVAVNGRRLSADAAHDEIQRVEQELGLPACDVYRDGADKLVDAAIALRDRLVTVSS